MEKYHVALALERIPVRVVGTHPHLLPTPAAPQVTLFIYVQQVIGHKITTLRVE